MSVLGVAVGVGISAAVIGALSAVGLSLGEEYSEMLERFNLPDRLYPTFDYATAFGMAALMVVAVATRGAPAHPPLAQAECRRSAARAGVTSVTGAIMEGRR